MATIVRRMDAKGKLEALRSLLKQYHLNAYIVPTSDAHNSEYVSAHDSRREFISGFTGSAGTAVITLSDAKLWTDGRYFLQADRELDQQAGWGLMKDREKETPSIEDWLGAKLMRGDVVGLNPFLFPLGTVRKMLRTLNSKGIQLSAASDRDDLVDRIWSACGQPLRPMNKLFVQPVKYAGESYHDKLRKVREAMASEGAAALMLTALDEIAWLFNLRGSDIDCNPVSIAYGIVTEEEAILCVDDQKVTQEVRDHLGSCVRIVPYNRVIGEVQATRGKVWVDPSSCNYAVLQAVVGEPMVAAEGSQDRLLEKMSPVTLLKAIKNPVEIDCMRQAHVRDAVALTAFFAWLEAAVTKHVDMRTGRHLEIPLTEYSVSQVLDGMRAQQAEFVSLSFPTIVGMGPNGAIIHYHPQEATAAPITDKGLFLCDSGGQYRDGTTDVTRTLHFGVPTEREKMAYTHVLKGHIAMSSAVFPTGTSGIAVDALARAPLWRAGLDYRHGTGHGVGAFLNVHEGPQGASSAARNAYDGGLKAGMTLTDEPGYYEDGAFGIRIENVLLIEAANTPNRFGGKPYLQFVPLTVVPISTRLVDAALLTSQELEWLNAYNANARNVLAPLVSDFVSDYLHRETAAVSL